MRRRLTYANVVATLALVFAMSGGALAAQHYLISSTKQINPKVLKKLRGATGKTGAAGAIGKEGPAGKEGKEGHEGKAATIPAAVWHELALEHSWSVYEEESGPDYGTPSYTKDASGFVHLSGAVAAPKVKSSQVFATLPVGFRPTHAELVWLRAAATDGEGHPELVDVEVSETGELIAEPASGATEKFVSLEGLTFYAG